MMSIQMGFLDLLNAHVCYNRYEEDPIEKAIICGSTKWRSGTAIRYALIVLAAKNREIKIIHGGARGADMITDTIARRLGLEVVKDLANWTGRGKIAGRERNKRMLSLKPDLIVAFKDGFDNSLSRGGTENMCKIGLESGVPVMHYSTSNGWRVLQ